MHENYLNCIEGNVRVWNIKEEDLDKFRITCQGRLSPEGATGFMLGTIFYISIFMFIIFVGDLNYYNNFFDRAIVKTEIVLFSIQIIFLIIYLFPKACFKFQKLQTLVILLYAFQLGTILFVVSIVSEMADNSTGRMYTGLVASALKYEFDIPYLLILNTFSIVLY